MMEMGPFDASADRQLLSALADGEADEGVRARVCAAWASDAGLRLDWHAWHLIGDVLRSDDLASDPRDDRRFCAALRTRLMSEPVVLAPEPRPVAAGGAARRTGRWLVGSAVAAGFALVVATFSLIRSDAPDPAPALASTAGSAARPLGAAPSPVVPATELRADATPPPMAVASDGRLVRDPQLDRYLAAHKQFAGISALGVPSVFLRSATVGPAPR